MDPLPSKKGDIMDLDRDDLAMLVPQFFFQRFTRTKSIKSIINGIKYYKKLLQHLSIQNFSKSQVQTFFVNFNVEDLSKKYRMGEVLIWPKSYFLKNILGDLNLTIMSQMTTKRMTSITMKSLWSVVLVTTYLQSTCNNIFFTFPSTEPESTRASDINASDGKYQIYKPFSDCVSDNE